MEQMSENSHPIAGDPWEWTERTPVRPRQFAPGYPQRRRGRAVGGEMWEIARTLE